MHRPIRIAVLAASLILIGVSAFGQEGMFNEIGSGTAASCGKWSETRQNRQAVIYQQWALGFLSGVGWTGTMTRLNPLNNLDGEAVLQWLDQYCHDHPLEPLTTGLAQFVYKHPR